MAYGKTGRTLSLCVLQKRCKIKSASLLGFGEINMDVIAREDRWINALICGSSLAMLLTLLMLSKPAEVESFVLLEQAQSVTFSSN